MPSENRYLHLIRQDCPLPPGTHVVVYCRDSGGEEQDRSVSQQIDTAHEYCQHHNLVLEKVYVDEARLSSNTRKSVMRCKSCSSICTVVSSESMTVTNATKPLARTRLELYSGNQIV